MAGDKAYVLASLSPQDTLQRYAAGEMISDIAKSLSVHPTSIYRDLIRDCPDQWIAHQAARSLAEYEKAIQHLDSLEASEGPVACSLAQARVKARQWELERTMKRLYGATMEVTGSIAHTIQIVKFGETIEGYAQPGIPSLPNK